MSAYPRNAAIGPTCYKSDELLLIRVLTNWFHASGIGLLFLYKYDSMSLIPASVTEADDYSENFAIFFLSHKTNSMIVSRRQRFSIHNNLNIRDHQMSSAVSSYAGLFPALHSLLLRKYCKKKVLERQDCRY